MQDLYAGFNLTSIIL